MIERPVIPGPPPRPKSQIWQKVVLILLGVLVGGGIVFRLMFADGNAAPGTTLFEPLHRVGDDVMVGDIRWKVVRAKDLGNHLEAEFVDDADTSGHFVEVTVEIENLGNESETLFSVDLIDRRARTFSTYGEQYFFIPDNQSCALETMNPNLPKTCTFIYEVPNNTEQLKLKATDLSIVDPELKLIDLGLD